MSEDFDYDLFFDKALKRIRVLQEPHSGNVYDKKYGYTELKKNVMFDFGYDKVSSYKAIFEEAKRVSYSILHIIIANLFKRNGDSVERIPFTGYLDKDKAEGSGKVIFTFRDKKTNCLILFMEIDNSISFSKDVSTRHRRVMDLYHATSFRDVYLLFGKAYHLIYRSEYDESDLGGGINVYDIKGFFVEYFGDDEFKRFYQAYIRYVEKVNEYLSIIFVQPLSSMARNSFGYVVESNLIKFNYASLANTKKGRNYLTTNELKKINTQYFDKKLFRALLGSHEFAESFITAEWLYTSMKLGKAADLTFIGSGYFKSIEQLLYELLCIDDPSFNDADDKDKEIGSMARRYKHDEFHSFRSDLNYHSRKYIVDTIYDYAEMRNNYFHKHNIKSWDRIEKIRNDTFNVAFLLLGSQSFIEKDLYRLGITNDAYYTDYYKLCEYVNFHRNELFEIISHGRNYYCVSMGDGEKHLEDGHIDYSGIYFRNTGEKLLGVIRFNPNNVPEEIYSCEFVISSDRSYAGLSEGGKEVSITIKRGPKIFDSGKYVGPSILDEIRRK